MNSKSNLLDRRSFLGLGIACASVKLAGCRTTSMADAPVDPNLSAFLSDIHVAEPGIETEWGLQPDYQNPMLARSVEDILALSPRPARVVVFGDVALWFGYGADYDLAAKFLKPLTDAGITLYVTAGNHDHRDGLFSRFPKQAEITPVPGRVVSVVDLGTADLFLLDSLDETGVKAGGKNRTGGALDDAQWNWLERTAKEWKRPFFVGAHHAHTDLNGRIVNRFLGSLPNFVGWIHGHDHRWMTDWSEENWVSHRIFRTACLPSSGWWGDIGFCTLRTDAGQAELKLHERDFYFPAPLKAGEPRPAVWDDVMRQNQNAACLFRW